jgi:hypothetical protein
VFILGYAEFVSMLGNLKRVVRPERRVKTDGTYRVRGKSFRYVQGTQSVGIFIF